MDKEKETIQEEKTSNFFKEIEVNLHTSNYRLDILTLINSRTNYIPKKLIPINNLTTVSSSSFKYKLSNTLIHDKNVLDEKLHQSTSDLKSLALFNSRLSSTDDSSSNPRQMTDHSIKQQRLEI